MIEAPVAAATDDVDEADEAIGTGTDPVPAHRTPTHRSSEQASRRRFTIAVTMGTAVVTVPYLWVLWSLWTGTVNPLRRFPQDDFYDLQARGMFAGHLWVPKGSLGIEGFPHDGHTYTYFGIWPSILRMPFLAFTHTFDRALTAPSLLLAWLLTAVVTALLIWRIRMLIRGNAVVGWTEAAAYGAFMAAIMGGSVLIFIAANPATFDEDFAWSVALVVASLFALLGMLERPTTARAVGSILLILAANLNRTPTGYACVIAALLVAGWFALGKGGRGQRHWAWWMGVAGVVPLLASCAVTYAKFGLPFGLPMADQVWAHVNAHRRFFLAANGGKAFNLAFIPSTLWAYMNPTAIRFSSVFPFIAAPGTPAHAVDAVVLDQTYPTTSITAASPLFVLLGAWGAITAFRPHGVGRVALLRLVLIGAAAATGGVLVWGYIAYRYVSDLMPLFILAGAIGLVDVWRRLDGRSRTVRRWALGAVAVLAVYGLAANVAIAAAPSTWFTSSQLVRFLQAQHALTPVALRSTVVTSDRLPYFAPADTLFVAGHCDALYRSTGDSYVTMPGLQVKHATWAPVEQSPRMIHTIRFRFNTTGWRGPDVSLLTYGRSTLVLHPEAGDTASLRVVHPGGPNIPWPSATGFPFPQVRGYTYELTVTTDPYLQSISITWYGLSYFAHFIAGTGPARVTATPEPAAVPLPPVTVTEVAPPPSDMSLCRDLVHR